ncbi:MAG: LamG-like jellyroll fold domain-containing protein, partial [Bacteroidota bacterium]
GVTYQNCYHTIYCYKAGTEVITTGSIKNCTFTNMGEYAIAADEQSVPIVEGNTIIGNGTALWGIRSVYGSNPTVSNNIISNVYLGIDFWNDTQTVYGTNPSATIDGNTVDNCSIGLRVYRFDDGFTVRNNSITNSLEQGIALKGREIVEYNLVSGGVYGIFVDEQWQGPSTITKNDIQNCSRGFYFTSYSNPATSGAYYSNNNFGQNAYHVENTSSNSVALPNNWWSACTEQQVSARMLGPVNFLPFLTTAVQGTGPYGGNNDPVACLPIDVVVEYKFENNLDDASGAGNNATGVGVSYTSGVEGQALQLAGTTGSYAYASDQFYYHIPQPTAEAWVNLAISGSGSGRRTLVSESVQGAWADGRGFVLYVHKGITYFKIGDASGIWKEAKGVTTLQANTWYHLAGVYDGTTLKVYVNGLLDGSYSRSVPICYDPITWNGPNPSTIYVGVQHDADNTAPTYTLDLAQPLWGTIDEVRVCNRPLTGAEILQRYQGFYGKLAAVNAAQMGVATEERNLPVSFAIEQNHPNPFNPETIIRYQLPAQGSVILRIYDLLGREVSTLVNRAQEPGHHTVVWDGEDNRGDRVPSGIYLYRFSVTPLEGESTKQFTIAKKMILMR